MAKRFIDTDLFKKQFFRTLKPAYKLLWIYVITDCNHAGVWECDFEVAQMRLGQKINKETAVKSFSDKIVEIDHGSKWFIPSFIEFQYVEISEKNKAHKNTIALLNKYNLWGFIKLPKPLGSPLEGAQVTVTAKEQDKEKEKEKENLPIQKNQPLGMRAVKEIANEVWQDQSWRETICMGFSFEEPELKKWMAQFNASISNDNHVEFTAAKYKKIFRGFVNAERGKGTTVMMDPIEKQAIPKRLQSLG